MFVSDTRGGYQTVSGWFQRKENEYSFPDILQEKDH